MPSGVARFADFELDVGRYELRRGDRVLKLEKIPMELLTLLVESNGQLVTRDQIIERIWGKGVFLDTEHGINTAIRKVRLALGDNPEQPRFVQTVTGKGYRFITPTIEISEGGNGSATGADSPSVVDAHDAIGSKPVLEQKAAPVPQKDSNAGKPSAPSLAIFGTLALLALAAALVGMNVAGWRDQIFARRPKPNIQALAVLPLANLSGDTEQEFFADGMTEALITELGKISGPRVISRQSVMEYKGSKKSLREIARELNVDAVLEGAVARSGDRVKVTVHLAQASPERQLWAQEYDRSLHDVLSLQGEIALAVMDEIRTKLSPEVRTRFSNARGVNPEAYADYLRGRSVLTGGPGHYSNLATKKHYTEQDIETAIAYFRHAIEKDPAYAEAYAGLADAYIHLGNPGWGGHSSKETLSDAKEAATTALKLDPALPEAHFSLAQTLQYDWNWPEAAKEYKLALKLNPYYVDAHLQYGRFVQALGRNDEALAHMHYADELDLLNIGVKETEAWVTYAARQYDLALTQFESLGADAGLVHAYREKGMYSEAIVASKRWDATHPSESRDPKPLAVKASIYGLQGRKDEAEALIKALKETVRHRHVSGFFFAEAYVGLGQRDQAIIWLERAYEEHDQWMVFANAYPGLDRLRSEPRFQVLMRRMNFPEERVSSPLN